MIMGKDRQWLMAYEPTLDFRPWGSTVYQPFSPLDYVRST